MGTYVNPGFDNFNSSRKNKFYVDKSMLIALLNEKIGTDDRFLCVSRPRRFGKTMQPTTPKAAIPMRYFLTSRFQKTLLMKKTLINIQ